MNKKIIAARPYRRSNKPTITLDEAIKQLKPNQTSFTIPEGVTSIPTGALGGNTELTSIKIPSSVIRIDADAFADCINLDSIDIPDSVTYIGEGTFRGCTNLKSISIPDSVTYIGEQAFYDCSNLNSIKIPNKVTSIKYGTFSNCSSLSNVSIPSSVTSIEQFAFYNCAELAQIKIPALTTSIGDLAFAGCTILKSVSIPDSVTSTGPSVFKNCENLSTIKLPLNLLKKLTCQTTFMGLEHPLKIQYTGAGKTKLSPLQLERIHPRFTLNPWGYRPDKEYKDFSPEAKRTVITIMLCLPRCEEIKIIGSSGENTPQLPIEMILAILEHLKPGDMIPKKSYKQLPKPTHTQARPV